MTRHASSPVASDSLIDSAAYWCMRLQADDCTDEERATFEHWLKSDPAHAREYQAMLDIWQVSEHLPRRATPDTGGAPPASRMPSRRRLFRPAAAVAAVLFLSLGIALGWRQGWLPNDIQHYHAAEQTREAVLPDGSRIQLNLGTTLWFGNFRDRRSVVLSEGEAFFEVQHDSRQPFVVYAGKGSVTVTGTRFNVWKYDNQVVVTLLEGSVKVRSDIEESDQVAHLSPGMQARYDTRSALPRVSAARAGSLAWREGKLVLDDLMLSEALPLINRYLDKPVLLADRATGNIRVGGIYDIHNVGQLVRTLPRVLPVYLSRNADGNTVINSREQL
ncbi:FecR family protein [Pseudomonas lopnurensis]|uniref:FecR family protein n=1 Tax=Pseudomonas lopnurensis TaxID=1477517 RepID=UPI0018799FD4|nr:FecR family protein [Pseudomonas lopnurensis]MBE7373884.1 FecR family protein [Pseudomonas lopnurensis]